MHATWWACTHADACHMWVSIPHRCPGNCSAAPPPKQKVLSSAAHPSSSLCTRLHSRVGWGRLGAACRRRSNETHWTAGAPGQRSSECRRQHTSASGELSMRSAHPHRHAAAAAQQASLAASSPMLQRQPVPPLSSRAGLPSLPPRTPRRGCSSGAPSRRSPTTSGTSRSTAPAWRRPTHS